MLADAVGSGQSVLVWALQRRSEGLLATSEQGASPEKPSGLTSIGAEAFGRKQGLTYLCARLIERNRVLAPRDTEQLLQELYQSGLAAPFGQPVSATSRLEPELPLITRQAANLLPPLNLDPGLDAAATDGFALIHFVHYALTQSTMTSRSPLLAQQTLDGIPTDSFRRGHTPIPG